MLIKYGFLPLPILFPILSIYILDCRRRLATILVRLKFAEHLKEAVTYIEQGHIRVGPETVTDPAFLVTRNMEDFVTWVDTSKIKKKVLEYNGKLDDYDAMNWGSALNLFPFFFHPCFVEIVFRSDTVLYDARPMYNFVQ